jgi:hypothetical protein
MNPNHPAPHSPERIPVDAAQDIPSPEETVEFAPVETKDGRVFGKIALESVRLVDAVPIDWKAAEEMIAASRPAIEIDSARNNLKKWSELTPAIASVIAHKHDPEIQPIVPTADMIKEKSFGARTISKVLNFFSSDWGKRFDNFLVKKAMRRINSIATRVHYGVETISTIDKPKQKVLSEVELFYNKLSEGGNSYKDAKLPNTMKLMSIFDAKLPVSPRMIELGRPEILQGLQIFLKNHGVDAPDHGIEPEDSRLRRLAEKFAAQRLGRVPNTVASKLEQVYGTLPEDGDDFTKSIYHLCKNIVHLSRAGHSGREITNAMMKNSPFKSDYSRGSNQPAWPQTEKPREN